MKIYVVQDEEVIGESMGCHALGSWAKAKAAKASTNCTLRKNSGPESMESGGFFKLPKASLGDDVWIALYFSDDTGAYYVGGVFTSHDEAQACLDAYKTWKGISQSEKNGSGELYVIETVIE